MYSQILKGKIMLELSTDILYYTADEKLFSQYSSDLNLSSEYWNSCYSIPHEKVIKITNPETGKSQVFEWVKTDFSDNEAMGWNYASKQGIKLLIIND